MPLPHVLLNPSSYLIHPAFERSERHPPILCRHASRTDLLSTGNRHRTRQVFAAGSAQRGFNRFRRGQAAGCLRDVSFSPPATATLQVRDSTRRPPALRCPAEPPARRAGRSPKHDDLSNWTVTDDWPERIPITDAEVGGGYRRNHLRALAQRVEVADREVRIMGSKSDLLRTLAAISGAKSATGGVRSSVLNWRRGRDSNP